MRLRFWASTDVGRVRKLNEDNFLVDKRLNLFVVCDGMGGHAAGEVASAIGVRTVRDVVHAHRELLERHERAPDDVPTRREVLKLVEKAVLDANSRVYEASIEDEAKRGMGTTCCLLLLSGKRGFIGHVGDSRIYMLRDNSLHQMTEDHSLYNEMVRMGKIKPGEPINLPNKNAVTRAVGVREHVEVDVMEFDVHPGDRILTCSDGLSGYFGTDEQVVGMMRGEVKDITESFIEYAVTAGGRDNITAIVVDVDSIEPEVDEDGEIVDELLRQVPYFQYLNAKEHAILRELVEAVPMEAGEVLFAPDETSDLYMVLKGSLALERDGEVFDVLEPGSCTGEVGFIDAQPNGYSGVAQVASKILVLERGRFMKLLKSKPALAVKLQWNFLQMFAIKIREAPRQELPELEIEPAVPIEDVTPTAGELVFREDQLRQGAKDAVSPEAPAPRPAAPPAPAVSAAASPPRPPPATATAPVVGRPTEPMGLPRPPVPRIKNPFSVRPPSLTSVNPFGSSPLQEASASDAESSKMRLGRDDVGLAEPTAPPSEDHTMDLDDAFDLLDFSDAEDADDAPTYELSEDLRTDGPPDDDLRATAQFDKDEFSLPLRGHSNTADFSEDELEGLSMTPSEIQRAAPSAQIMKPKRKKRLAISGSSQVADPHEEDLVSTVQLDPNEIKRKLAERMRSEAASKAASKAAEVDPLDQPTQQMVRPDPEEIAARANKGRGKAQPSRKVVVNFDE